MAEYRKITEVEEIDALTGDEKILVEDHGTLKRIGKDNAKFGGGGVTVFTLTANANVKQLADFRRPQ